MNTVKHVAVPTESTRFNRRSTLLLYSAYRCLLRQCIFIVEYVCTHNARTYFNVQSFCLNNSLVYLLINFGNVHMQFLLKRIMHVIHGHFPCSIVLELITIYAL
jgi:hypothetical protein